MLLEKVRRALTRRNIKWLLTRLENHFKSNQICFYSDHGKVFQLPEFHAKLFLSEFEWVVLRETASQVRKKELEAQGNDQPFRCP